ncbi:hypothetical protein BH10PSE9_BH10PSE9_13110 [soil metagenome]
MISIQTRIAPAAVLALALAFPAGSFAAAPDKLDPAPAAKAPAKTIVPLEYVFGKEVVVRNWVLCISQPFAESIVNAWSGGVSQAEKVYADLKAAKSCGQFPELRVILHESVYESGPGVDHVARVFAAQVNLGGGWPTGFVVFGGLPAPTAAVPPAQ